MISIKFSGVIISDEVTSEKCSLLPLTFIRELDSRVEEIESSEDRITLTFALDSYTPFSIYFSF